MKSLKALLIAMLVGSLLACGSGGGGGGNADPSVDEAIDSELGGVTDEPTVNEIPAGSIAQYGIIQDGYIGGATVFLDLNGDLQASVGEPTATSDANGGFYLIATPAQFAASRVIAEVPLTAIDITRSRDLDDVVYMNRAMLLMAPAGEPAVINPITTLIAAQQLADPLKTADELRTAFAQQWLSALQTTMPVDLKADYQAAAAATNDAALDAAYQLLHRAAEMLSYAYSRSDLAPMNPTQLDTGDRLDYLDVSTTRALMNLSEVLYYAETMPNDVDVIAYYAEILNLNTAEGDGQVSNDVISNADLGLEEYTNICANCHTQPERFAAATATTLLNAVETVPEMADIAFIYTDAAAVANLLAYFASLPL